MSLDTLTTLIAPHECPKTHVPSDIRALPVMVWYKRAVNNSSAIISATPELRSVNPYRSNIEKTPSDSALLRRVVSFTYGHAAKDKNRLTPHSSSKAVPQLTQQFEGKILRNSLKRWKSK